MKLLMAPNGRLYAPEIGRFLSRDPAAALAGNYLYCGSDPVSMADPEGYDETVVKKPTVSDPSSIKSLIDQAERRLKEVKRQLRPKLLELRHEYSPYFPSSDEARERIREKFPGKREEFWEKRRTLQGEARLVQAEIDLLRAASLSGLGISHAVIVKIITEYIKLLKADLEAIGGRAAQKVIGEAGKPIFLGLSGIMANPGDVAGGVRAMVRTLAGKFPGSSHGVFGWRQASMAREFLKEAERSGGCPVIIIGHSFGGDVASDLAVELNRNNSGTVRALVTIDVTWQFGGDSPATLLSGLAKIGTAPLILTPMPGSPWSKRMTRPAGKSVLWLNFYQKRNWLFRGRSHPNADLDVLLSTKHIKTDEAAFTTVVTRITEMLSRK